MQKAFRGHARECSPRLFRGAAEAVAVSATMPPMKAIPLRVQLGLVGAGYASVVAIAGALIFARYMLYVTHPQDAAAAGGMYAAGDTILALMIAGMFLAPTFFLALVVRKSEHLSLLYSRFLLGLSLTAPLCLGLLSIPAVNQGPMLPGEILLDRLFCSPVVIVAFAFSRVLARFQRGKQLTLYALLIEVLTLILTVVLFLFPAGLHRS